MRPVELHLECVAQRRETTVLRGLSHVSCLNVLPAVRCLLFPNRSSASTLLRFVVVLCIGAEIRNRPAPQSRHGDAPANSRSLRHGKPRRVAADCGGTHPQKKERSDKSRNLLWKYTSSSPWVDECHSRNGATEECAHVRQTPDTAPVPQTHANPHTPHSGMPAVPPCHTPRGLPLDSFDAPRAGE